MKRIAFVNQRYGLEVNGGSEYYTRLVAEKLKNSYEVEILTTKALSYETWDNYYRKDIEQINGITVRRFRVRHRRNVLLQKLLSRIMRTAGAGKKAVSALWVKAQGPYCPELIRYIRQNKERYDVFIFVTYLYYPAAEGLKEVADKAVLVPTAHDEFCIYYPVYRKLLTTPKALIYLTEEEKDFVQKTFHNENILSTVSGIGTELPKDIEERRFRKKYNIEGKYLVYAGRIDENKGCGEMIQFFLRFAEMGMKLQLVIMGQAFMKLPEDNRIRYLGFVSEEDKFDGIKGAEALWLPSQFESLSISVIEAMSLGVPVIVNGRCNVLKGHCIRSGAGCWYADYSSFETAMGIILGEGRESMAAGGINYVKKNYSWEKVIRDYRGIIEKVAEAG